MKKEYTEAEATERLWRICFKDTDEFIRLYFQMRYKDEINMPVYGEGKMIAALQMIPYPMTLHGRIIPTSYISGACTHPAYRNKGIMGGLLSNCFRRMYSDGVLMSTLIPAEEWLFDYYSKYGYTVAFDYSLHQTDMSQLNEFISHSITEYVFSHTSREIYSYFSHKMHNRPCCIQHTPEDFEVVLADLRLSGGKLFVCHTSSEITGLAFCIPEKARLYMPELLYNDITIRNSLFKKASDYFNMPKIEYLSPATGINDKRLGMARIIHVERILQLYAQTYHTLQITLAVSDNIISENCGIFRVTHGTCERINKAEKDCIPLTINELTQVLLGYRVSQLPSSLQNIPSCRPYMSLMLN